MCTSRYAYQAPSAMLRARRRDANVRPNRWLDKKSSRGMIFENEELRLRTIEINAEVERGQDDIKKLKRQNDQLRRDIWCLRDEYAKLEERYERMRSSGARSSAEEDDEDLEDFPDDEYPDEEGEGEQRKDEEPIKVVGGPVGEEDADNSKNAHLASAKLLGLREQAAGCEHPPPEEPPPPLPPPPPDNSGAELTREPRDKPDLIVMQPSCPQFEPQQLAGSVRRRTLSGDRLIGIGSQHPSRNEARLSLPVSSGGRIENNSPPVLGDTTTTGTAPSVVEEPWWPSSTQPASPAEEVAAWIMPWLNPSGSNNEQNLDWPGGAIWAVAPFKGGPGALPATLGESPSFPPPLRRRAPPPPPPKPPTHEQVTVRRASSVLPDGTTRRSVTFQADSVTYIPPPCRAPPPPPFTIPDNLSYDTAVSCRPHDTNDEEDEEMRLLVRGLERVPGLGARELIDALEERLGGGEILRGAIKGVCLHHQARPAATATVSIANRATALRLMASGLETRGETLSFEQEPSSWRAPRSSDPTQQGPAQSVLLVSGVAHNVSDAAVRAAVSRACGLFAHQVCRNIYKGIDLGERVVRVGPAPRGQPLLSLPGPRRSSLSSESQQAQVDGGRDDQNGNKFRTHLSVQLRKPGGNAVNGESAPLRCAPPVPEGPKPQMPPSPLALQYNGTLTSPPPYTPPPPPPPARRPSTSGNANNPPPADSENGIREETVPAPPKTTQQPQQRTPLTSYDGVQQANGTPPGVPTGVVRKKASVQQNGGILRRADDPQVQARRAAKSRSVSVESSVTGRGGQHRRRLGVFERPPSELLGESRGSRGEDILASLPPPGPALPWCACWGNGCI